MTANKIVNIKTQFLIFGLMFLSSCYAPGNYQVIRHEKGEYGTHVVMIRSSKYPFIVIESGDSSWQLVNSKLNRENSSISGSLIALPSQKVMYKISDPYSNDTIVRGSTVPFKEVHVRVSKLNFDSTGAVVIYKEDIMEIKDFHKDYRLKKETTLALAIVGGTMVTMVIIIPVITSISQRFDKSDLNF